MLRAPILALMFSAILPSLVLADLVQDRHQCAQPLSPHLVAAACARLQKSKLLDKDGLAALHHQRGNALQRLKRFKRAIAAYNQALQLNRNSAEIVTDRGQAYFGARRYRRAIQDFTLAIRFDPKHANAYYHRGIAHGALRQFERSIADFNTALRLRPKFAAAYFQRARIYLRLNQNTRALWDFNKALALNPKLAAAYLSRGHVYRRSKWHRRGIKEYDRAIKLQPNNYSAYYHRGIALMKIRQHKRAILDFDTVLRLKPKIASAYYYRAVAHDSLKQHQQAVADYDQAIRLNPRLANAYTRRGLIFEKLKDNAAAINDYKMARYLRPGDKRLIFRLKRLGASIAPKPPAHAMARPQVAKREMVLRAGASGHFYVPIKINGTSLRLLVDTGATSTVLKQSDARRAGLSLKTLPYKYSVRTANGLIKMARANIAEIKIGGAVFWNVTVLISPRDDISVVGVRTLSRFKSYTVAGDTLTLRW